MRRIAMLAVLVLVLMAMAVPAFATPPDHANDGGRTCVFDIEGDQHGVGPAIKTLMDRTYPDDTHPANVIVVMDTVIFYDDPLWGGTVGGLIADKC